MTRSITLLILLLLAGLALALRVPHLGQRPMHNDEAVNAVKFGRLWEKGSYQYDPNEHHGPALYYGSLALGRLTAAPDFVHFTEARLRALPVLFGLGLVLLLPLTVDGLGRRGTLWAALFTALSPAMVFYSRYYIHEILLVFFTFLALAAGWRYWRSRQLGWALLCGVALGLMAATKETFVFNLLAAAVALGLNQLWNRCLDASGLPVKAPPLRWAHLAAGLALCLLAWFLLFSSFFTNPQGPLDSFRTYLPWLQRAGGESPHIHPWHFYFQRLLFFHAAKGPFWTEAFIFLLALVGAGTGFIRKQLGRANASFVRFLALYTATLTAIYTVLPYKTPWCLLGFWHGAILLAGFGAAVLVRKAGRPLLKVPLTVLFLAGAAHLGWQAWQANDAYAADQRNPHVYAHTSPDLLQALAQVEALAQASPQPDQMLIKVIAPDGDYWPLPWYLRRFKQVGWWEELPADPHAPVMLVSAKLHANLDEKGTHLMPRIFALRPQVFFELYVEVNLWTAWLAKNPPKPE